MGSHKDKEAGRSYHHASLPFFTSSHEDTKSTKNAENIQRPTTVTMELLECWLLNSSSIPYSFYNIDVFILSMVQTSHLFLLSNLAKIFLQHDVKKEN